MLEIILQIPLDHCHSGFAGEEYSLVEVVEVVLQFVNCHCWVVHPEDLLELLHFHDKLEGHLLMMRRIDWL